MVKAGGSKIKSVAKDGTAKSAASTPEKRKPSGVRKPARPQKERTLQSKAKLLAVERTRLLHLLEENTAEQSKVQAAVAKKAKSGGTAGKSKDDVFTLLSDDILHSAILPLLPAKTLVLLSMTCGRARAVVDSAPIELCLWSGPVPRLNSISSFAAYLDCYVDRPLLASAKGYNVYARQEAREITLSRSYGEWTGKPARSLTLTEDTASNLLLPHALGTTISIANGREIEAIGKIVFVKDGVNKSEIKTWGENCTSRVLVDAGAKGLYRLKSPKLCSLPPRVLSALALAKKCLKCKKKTSKLTISPIFPPAERVLCSHCRDECTVRISRVKKNLSPFDHAALDVLPKNTCDAYWSYSCNGTLFKDALVLKKDVADLHGMSWDEFVQTASSRNKKRQEQAKAKMLKERAERKWEAEEYLEAGQSLVLRLAKLAGAAATERNNFRVTDSGTPMGLLTGTSTFKMCYHRMPEVEQMLRTLESGSSSKSRISGALKDFQAQVAKELRELEVKRRSEIIPSQMLGRNNTGLGLFTPDGHEDHYWIPFHQIKHQDHFNAIILDICAKDRLVSHELGLVLTGPWDFKIGAGSEGAWKSLFEDLQAQLLLRLAADKAFCRRPAAAHPNTDCMFCRQHRDALEGAVSDDAR